jgi:selenide,water dikinase
VLLLTKPLGVGIVTTGIKQCRITDAEASAAIQSMAALNRPGAVAARAAGASAATDITGFGLLGHLGGIARESNVTIELDFAAIPKVEHAERLVQAGVAPGGTRRNLAYYGSPDGGAGIKVRWDGEWQEWQKLLIADAQTCGGMVICVDEGRVPEAVNVLKSEGALASSVIGRVGKPTGTQLVLKL